MANIKKLLILISKKKRVETVRKRVVKPELILTRYEPSVRSDEERFRDKIKLVGDCWEWQGRLDRYGYGSFKAGKKTYKAHRYSYQLHHGFFDFHLHVLHTCDNPRCVNPQHLFLGTNSDNISDKVKKGRSVISYRRLSELEKHDILKLVDAGVSMKHVAEQFNLHVGTIRRLHGQRNVS